jgi:hypothetical protein
MAREIALPLELEEERPEQRRRLRKILQTARRHPLGVFGLICISLLFFCGIFAQLSFFGIGLSITPYNPIDVIREERTFGVLAEPVDATDDKLVVSDSTVEAGTNFNIDQERISVVTVLSTSSEGTRIRVQRGSSPESHDQERRFSSTRQYPMPSLRGVIPLGLTTTREMSLVVRSSAPVSLCSLAS